MSTQKIHLANILTPGKSSARGLGLNAVLDGRATSLETFWKKKQIQKVLDDVPEVELFMDSGAHSLLNHAVGLVGTSYDTGVDSEKRANKDGTIEFSEMEFEDTLDRNQQISYASKNKGAVQSFTDFSFNDTPEVQAYLDDYIVFCHKYKDHFDGYANLDIVYNAEGSWKNMHKMEANGLVPVPVFHYGEDFCHFRKMVDNYEYIGIGGVAGGITLKQFVNGLGNKAFEYIQAVNPDIKVHGFAVTSFSLMHRYSWYSVDSVVGESHLLIRELGRIRVETIQGLFNCTEGKKKKQSSGHEYKTLKDVETFVTDDVGNGSWKPVSKVIRHSVSKTKYRVKTKTGRQLTLTGDHGLFVHDDSGLSCLPTSQVKLGNHCVGVDYNTNEQTNNVQEQIVNIDRKTYASESHPSTTCMRKLPSKIKFDSKFLEFCGLWIADGSYSSLDNNAAVQISAANDSEHMQLLQDIAKRYNCKLRIDNNEVDASISSSKLMRTMKVLGLVGHSHTKEVPWWVFDLSKENLGSFLRGYFSGDGTCCNDIECSTTSGKLLYGVFFLLQSLGIDVRIYESTHSRKIKTEEEWGVRPCHNLSIGNLSSLKLFQEKIGFLPGRKNIKLQESISSISENRGTRSEKENNHSFLKVMKITTIAPEQSTVYDLEVPDGQKFVANGLLVHNSTTWLKLAAYGKVIVPRYISGQGVFDYTCQPLHVSVSELSKLKPSTHAHYTLALSPKEIEAVNIYLAEVGVDMEQLGKDITERFKVNIYYYQKLLEEGSIKEKKVFRTNKSFF